MIKPQSNNLVLQFMLGRAMELALKAFLVRHGFSERRLRGIGHSLLNAFAAAEKNGFRMTGGNDQARDEWLEILNDHYSSKLFEYPLDRGYRTLNLRTVRNMVARTTWSVALALCGEAHLAIEAESRGEEIGLNEWPAAHYEG